ncbi:hypothetical protein QTN25_000671 [Entamoeba marina]
MVSRVNFKDLEFNTADNHFKCHFTLKGNGDLFDYLTLNLTDKKYNYQIEYIGAIEVLKNPNGLGEVTQILDIIENRSNFFVQFNYKGMVVRILAKIMNSPNELYQHTSKSPSLLTSHKDISSNRGSITRKSSSSSTSNRHIINSVIADSEIINLKNENKELRSIITDLSTKLECYNERLNTLESNLKLNEIKNRIDIIESNSMMVMKKLNEIEVEVNDTLNSSNTNIQKFEENNNTNYFGINSSMIKIQNQLDKISSEQELLVSINNNYRGIINDNLCYDSMNEYKEYNKKHYYYICIKNGEFEYNGLCFLVNTQDTTEVKILVNHDENIEFYIGEYDDFDTLCSEVSTSNYSIDPTNLKLFLNSPSLSLVLQQNKNAMNIWSIILDLYSKYNEIKEYNKEMNNVQRSLTAIPDTFQEVSSNIIDHNCVTETDIEHNQKKRKKQLVPPLAIQLETVDSSIHEEEEEEKEHIFVYFSENNLFNKDLLEQISSQIPQLHFIDYKLGVKRNYTPSKILLYYFCSNEDSDYRSVMKSVLKRYKKVPLYVLCVKMPGKTFMLDTDGVKFLYISKLLKTNLIDNGSAFKRLIQDIH